ncbi:MAG: TetR/AcrR family transcriptional regulator [Candidatus Aminicenantes bacterium]|jgi:AcrR family transcriptional regulator
MIKKYSRKERQKHRAEDNRLFLLEAAEKVFTQKGYSLTTVDDIAKEAQFSKATIYRYFKSKSEIFIQVIMSSFEELLLELEDLRQKELSAEEKIRELIRATLVYFHRKKNTVRIFYAEKDAMRKILGMDPKEHFSHASLQTRIPKGFLVKAREITRTLTFIIKQGIETGEFKRIDAEQAGSVLGAMIRGFAFKGPFRAKEFSIEETTDMLHEYFLYGISNRKDIHKERKK